MSDPTDLHAASPQPRQLIVMLCGLHVRDGQLAFGVETFRRRGHRSG
ncbi:hypothetical protein ACWEO2_40780 [Nocardia sp. NPDC004278]